MRQLIFTYLVLGVLFVFASCATKQYQTLFEQRNTVSDTLLRNKGAGLNSYRIQPQDVLQIRNLQNSKTIVDLNPGLSQSSTQATTVSQGETFQVESDSTVALTGLGHVKVVGLTRLEAQKLIESLYHKVMLKDPLIELKIVNLKVTLLGEVKTQGNFPLVKDRTTIVDLIGEAGGLTEKANEKNIKIIRGSEQNPVVTLINLNDLGAINSPDGILQSGDIIYVSQSKRASRNDNLSNFSVIAQPVILLLNTALIIISLTRR